MDAIAPILAGDAITADWLNTLVDRLNALSNIQYAPLGIARALVSEANVLHDLSQVVARARAEGSVQGLHAWQVIPQEYVGGGSPPADQSRKIKLAFSFVNHLPPENMGTEFTLADNKITVFIVKAAFDSSGEFEHSHIEAVPFDLGDDTIALDPDPTGSEDVAPVSSSEPLVLIQVVNGTIDFAGIVYQHNSALNVGKAVTDVACDRNLYAYKWTGQVVNLIATIS